MAYGVTSSGFVRPRLAEIKTNLENIITSTFGADTNVSPESVWGQLIGILAEREDVEWQAMEDVYNSQYPDTAFGTSLDNVGAISGIPRKGAVASRVLGERLFGTPGSLIPAGTQLSVLNAPSSVFATENDVTLVAGQDTIQRITFSTVPDAGAWKIGFHGQVTGSLAFGANAAAVQAALRLLPFAGGAVVTGDYSVGFTIDFGGVSGLQEWEPVSVVDNTLTTASVAVTTPVTVLQAGINQGAVNCTATATGPVQANAGTLDTIVNPVSGLSSVMNVEDAVVGRDVETDNAYRARRQQELQVAGAGTVEAIRAGLLSLSGVTAVIVFENITESPDIDGRPAKSFEAVVEGGTDQEIIDKLWEIKPAGIRTVGSTSGTAIDSMGQTHTINFSRPTQIPIYVAVTITKNAKFPTNGAAVALANILAAGNALGIGTEVVVNPYLMASLASIPGIDSLTFFISTAPGPTTPNTITIAINEVSAFDSSRISITTI